MKNTHGFCIVRRMKQEVSWKLSVALAVCVFILLVCVFSAWKAALSQREAPEHDADGISVVATVYPLYVSLLNITQGTPARPSLLTPAGTGCVHDWQLTTGDMKRLEAADLVIASGEGMEGFLDKLLTMKGDALVAVCEGWPHREVGNPHIWLSPDGAAWQAARIAEALSNIDSTNSQLYMSNCGSYTARLEELGQQMRGQLAPYRGRKVALFHEAFVYLAGEAALDVTLTITEEELSSPTPKRISEVSSLLRDAQGRGDEVVCFADTTSSATVKAIEQEAEAHVWQLDTCTTGELVPSSYISAMEANIRIMQAAFGGGR